MKFCNINVFPFFLLLTFTARVDKGERLALGTRVTRGPDWEWAEQDAQGPGTVINHHERRKYTQVCAPDNPSPPVFCLTV